MIDAGEKGNLSRFINHSCEPNLECQKWEVNGETRIGFFAITDIEPGKYVNLNEKLFKKPEDPAFSTVVWCPRNPLPPQEIYNYF